MSELAPDIYTEQDDVDVDVDTLRRLAPPTPNPLARAVAAEA